MSLLDIILLAVALAMDCLTVSIVSGLLVRQMRPYRMALLFGFFQALMPLTGWAGISYFSHYLEAVDHWIAFSLLAFIGGKMIKDALGPDQEHHFDPRQLNVQLLLAIATSIDALAVGISMGCTGYERLSQLWLPLTVIGGVSLLFSLAGFYAGRRFGNIISRRLRPELLGGVILIGIGVKILITHLTA